MNRNQSLVSDLVHASKFSINLDEAVDIAGNSASTSPAAHAVFTPLHYESSYAYPLVVWLHGDCDNEQQLKRIMPLVSMQNYVAVAPRGTEPQQIGPGKVAGSGKVGYRWKQSLDHIGPAEQAVFDCIEAVQRRFHLAPSRVFLAGYADGGTMACRIGLNNPHRFAGAISLSGPLPTDHRPLRNLVDIRDLPIMLAVGRDSRRYRDSHICHDLRLLHAAGMSVTLRQYPCGDDLTTRMLSDMDCWMMEQICPPHGPEAE